MDGLSEDPQIDVMDIAREIAQKLLQINAIKLSPQKPFTWASGLRSPIYCDNRIALSHPEVRSRIIEGMATKSAEFRPFNLIAGVATAGIAHGALLADKLVLPFVYVRSKAKAHGRQNLIEGALQTDQRALVVEDLISTGGSCLNAAKALQESGVGIAGVIAIFSYGFDKAKAAFDAENIPFTTLSNYEILIEEAVNNKYLSEADLASLRQWRQAPETWSSQFT